MELRRPLGEARGSFELGRRERSGCCAARKLDVRRRAFLAAFAVQIASSFFNQRHAFTEQAIEHFGICKFSYACFPPMAS